MLSFLKFEDLGVNVMEMRGLLGKGRREREGRGVDDDGRRRRGGDGGWTWRGFGERKRALAMA